MVLVRMYGCNQAKNWYGSSRASAKVTAELDVPDRSALLKSLRRLFRRFFRLSKSLFALSPEIQVDSALSPLYRQPKSNRIRKESLHANGCNLPSSTPSSRATITQAFLVAFLSLYPFFVLS